MTGQSISPRQAVGAAENHGDQTSVWPGLLRLRLVRISRCGRRCSGCFRYTNTQHTEDNGDQRIGDIEESKRQVRQGADTKSRRHVGPAGVPRHQCRRYGRTVANQPRQVFGREFAVFEFVRVDTARQRNGDVLVGGEDINPEGSGGDGKEQPTRRFWQRRSVAAAGLGSCHCAQARRRRRAPPESATRC